MAHVDPYTRHRSRLCYGMEAMATPGTKASKLDNYLGIVPSADLPELTVENKQYYAMNESRDVAIQKKGKHELSGGSIPTTVQNGEFLVLPFGLYSETGTPDDAGLSTTSTAAVARGGLIIALTAVTNLAVNDYIIIDHGGTNPEIRKVTAIDALNVTVGREFFFAHDSGVDVKELDETAAITHTITGANYANIPTITIEDHAFDGTTTTTRWFQGVVIDGVTIEGAEEGELKATYELLGMKLVDGSSPQTVTETTTVPFIFDEIVITALGGALTKAKSFSLKLSNNGHMNWYERSTDAEWAAEYIAGNRNYVLTLKDIASDDNWHDALLTQTDQTVTITCTRAAGDTLTITCSNCRLTKAPMPLPEEGEREIDAELDVKSVSIAVVDLIPTYHDVDDI